MVAAAALGAILFGCQDVPPIAPPPGEGDIAFTASLDPDSNPLEGEIGDFDICIRNTSKKYVILRDLMQPGGGSFLTWQRALSGKLAFDPASGEFVYDPGNQPKAPAPAFNVALLCPGEEIRCKVGLRLLQLPRRFALTWFSYGKTELSDMVYFEAREERGIRYRRLFGDDLDIALTQTPTRDAASLRTVVFPHAETLLETPFKKNVALDAEVRPRRFGLKDAVAKAGMAPETELAAGSSTFYSTHGRWVLRTPNGIVMVDEEGILPLPQINDIEGLFFQLDNLGSTAAAFPIRAGIEVRLSRYRFKILPVGYPLHRYVLFAGRTDIPALLRALTDEKLRIDRVVLEGAPRFVIRQ